MNDMEKMEELTKALQEGKTLVRFDGKTMKNLNGFLALFSAKGVFEIINPCMQSCKDWKIQEPEPIFEITPNQLAEYECRDGSKAICYGCFIDSKAVVLFEGGMFSLVYSNGKQYENKEYPKDLIRKIRDL